jgi:hypothetical protein
MGLLATASDGQARSACKDISSCQELCPAAVRRPGLAKRPVKSL